MTIFDPTGTGTWRGCDREVDALGPSEEVAAGIGTGKATVDGDAARGGLSLEELRPVGTGTAGGRAAALRLAPAKPTTVEEPGWTAACCGIATGGLRAVGTGTGP